MIRRPPISTRTDTLFPYTTLFRSECSLIRDLVDKCFNVAFSVGLGPTVQTAVMWDCDNIRSAHAVRNCSNRRGVDGRISQGHKRPMRSEEHTSELQSLMRISYAVFCLKKKQKHTHRTYVQK